MPFDTVFTYIKQIGVEFWMVLAEMSPYLLFGFLVAGLLSALISQRIVERHLGGRGLWPLVKASVFGVPLPLCSCGVIPVSMSLHKHGASRGSTVSFLLSTPQTGVDSIFVTLSLLGPVFAIFRPLAAFATGIFGGAMVNIFGGRQEQEKEKCTDECCSIEVKTNKLVRGLRFGFVVLPRDIGRAMLIGLVIAAFISAVVPKDFFAQYLGTGIFAMVVMMVLGIPVYVCATASVPVAAALLAKGITPGAAIVFLMTGPATNAAAFVTIWKTLGARTAVTYIISVAACALASGILLDYVIFSGNFESVVRPAAWMLPNPVKYISAVILLAILLFAIFKNKWLRHTESKHNTVHD